MSRSFQTLARRFSGLLGRDSAPVRLLRPTYERLLNAFNGGRGIPYEINGASFRISPFHRQLVAHDYDPEVAELLRERISPGALCLDVGANIGVYALQLARWTGPTGKVIAFEPNPGARAVLEQHILWNDLGDRVQVEPAAIGGEEGEVSFFAQGTDLTGRLSAPNPQQNSEAHQFRVPVTTLSHYCERNRLEPEWIVFDIEGFEIHALAGLESYLASARKPVNLIIELHPGLWPSAGTSLETARVTFQRLNLEPRALSGQKDLWHDHGSIFATAKQS